MQANIYSNINENIINIEPTIQINISILFQYSKRVSAMSIIYNPIIKYENIINNLTVNINDCNILLYPYFKVRFNPLSFYAMLLNHLHDI